MIYNVRLLLRRSFSTVAVQDSRTRLCTVTEGRKKIKKKIRVAIIGKPNIGKSTLINSIMGMNICAVSVKPQTTIGHQIVFNIEGDTEVVLLDTPGILSQSDLKKYKLPKKVDVFGINAIKKVDLVGILMDASDKYTKYIPSDVKLLMSRYPSNTEMVLILNKMDLVKDKSLMLKWIDRLCYDLKQSENVDVKNRVFTRIFMISALKNDGVKDVVEYFRSVAPEKNNCVSSGRLSALQDFRIVEQRVRAALLKHFKQNIPYNCSCKVEYMDENASGKLNIIVIILCPSVGIYKIIFKPILLEVITRECEEDLEQVFGKPVSLRLHTVCIQQKKK